MKLVKKNALPKVAFEATFQKYWVARFLSTFCVEVINVSIAWKIYDITENPLYLGLVGLTQFVPLILLGLISGYVSDKYNRKNIFFWCLIIEAIIASSFIIINSFENVKVIFLFYPLIALGIVRAFFGPASSALLPNIVTKKTLPDAVALSAISWQTGSIFGPIFGGFIYGISENLGYVFAFLSLLLAALLIFTIPKTTNQEKVESMNFKNLIMGFSYVWNKKILLGVISLDLFAVIFAGAIALLPIYARDILETGPTTLGLLRASPGIGAILVAILLSRYSIKNNSGLVMLFAVALFGLFTMLFGISTNTTLSIIFLCFIGGFDMLSVYIREIIVQLGTEDKMRGRVNSINMMFVGASNELGEFRAGIMAFWMGSVPAVVLGGMGAIAITGFWSILFPELRKLNKLKGNFSS